jgi:hypothetical protein
MSRNWKSIRSTELVNKIKEHTKKKEKKVIELLNKKWTGFKVVEINQDDYKTHKDRKPDAYVEKDNKIIFYIEITASHKYSFKKHPKYKLSKFIRVEADKQKHFVNGYKGKVVYFCYCFADEYIKFCKFSEMEYKGFEIVRSFGQNEKSENCIIGVDKLYDLDIIKEKDKYVVKKNNQ